MATPAQGSSAGWASMAVITTTGLDKASRQQVQNSVEAAGGTYSAALHKGCTHLIVSTRLTEATDKLAVAAGNAARWQLNVVSPAWWCDSVQQGKLLPEQSYKHPMQSVSFQAAAGLQSKPCCLPPSEGVFVMQEAADTADAVPTGTGAPTAMPQLQAPWHVHFSQIPVGAGVYPAAPGAAAAASAAASRDTGARMQPAQDAGHPAGGAMAASQQPAPVQRGMHKRSSTAGSPPTSSKQLLVSMPGVADNGGGSILVGASSSSSSPHGPRQAAAAAAGDDSAPRRHTHESQPTSDINELLQQLSSSRFLRRNSTQGYSRQQEGDPDLVAASSRRSVVAASPADAGAAAFGGGPAAHAAGHAGPEEVQGNMLEASCDRPDDGYGAGGVMVSMDFRRLLGQLHQALAAPASPSSMSPTNAPSGQTPAKQQQQQDGSSSGSQPYMSGDVRMLLQQLRLASSGGAALAVAQGAEPDRSSPGAVVATAAPSATGQLQGYKQQQASALARPVGLVPSRSPSKDGLLSKAVAAAAAAATSDMGPIPDGMRPMFDGAGGPPQHLNHAATFGAHRQAPGAEGLPQRRRHTADLASQRPQRRTWEDKGALAPNSTTSSGNRDMAGVEARAGAVAGGAQGQSQDLQQLLRQLGRCSAPGAPLTAEPATSRGEVVRQLAAPGSWQPASSGAGMAGPSEGVMAGGGTILSLDQLLQRLTAAAGPTGVSLPAAAPAEEVGHGPKAPPVGAPWSSDTATLAAQLMAYAEQAPESAPQSPAGSPGGAGDSPLAASAPQAAAPPAMLQPTLSSDVAQLLAAVRRATGDHPPSAAEAAAAAGAGVHEVQSVGPERSLEQVLAALNALSDKEAGREAYMGAITTSPDQQAQQRMPQEAWEASQVSQQTATAAAGGGGWSPGSATPSGGMGGRSSPSMVVQGTPSAASGGIGAPGTPSSGGTATSAPPAAALPQQPRAPRRSSRPSLLLLLPEGAGSQTSPEQQLAALSSLNPVSPKLLMGVGTQALVRSGSRAADGSSSSPAGGKATELAGAKKSSSSSSSSSNTAGTGAIIWSRCVVHLDPCLPEEVAEQLQVALQAAGAALTQSAHLGSPVTLVVTEPVTASNWLHLLVDIASPAYCLAQLQQQQGQGAAGGTNQQQQMVRLSPDVARAVWRTTKQRSMVARASTGGAAAATTPQQQGAVAASNRPGDADPGATTNATSSSSAFPAGGGGWVPQVLLPGVSWSVLDPPEVALTAEELESIVLQGVTGGLTLLLPQGCSPLLGVQALSLAADTPSGAICAGSLLRAIHGFYQAAVEAPAALLELVVGGGGAAGAGGLSQLGSQVAAAAGADSPGRGVGVPNKQGLTKVTRGALLGAGVCFAGLQRVQGSSYAAVYRLLLN